MFITRYGRKIQVEQIKCAHLSSGYVVYWFRALKPLLKGNNYIVAVHNPQGKTEHYITLSSAQSASSFFLNWLCCYA